MSCLYRTLKFFLLQDKRKFVQQTFFSHLRSFLPCRRLVSPSTTTFPSALHRLIASFLQLKSTFTLTSLRMTCSFPLSSTFPFFMILLHILLQLIFSLILDGLLVFHRRGFTLTNSQHGSTRPIVLFLSFLKMPATCTFAYASPSPISAIFSQAIKQFPLLVVRPMF